MRNSEGMHYGILSKLMRRKCHSQSWLHLQSVYNQSHAQYYTVHTYGIRNSDGFHDHTPQHFRLQLPRVFAKSCEEKPRIKTLFLISEWPFFQARFSGSHGKVPVKDNKCPFHSRSRFCTINCQMVSNQWPPSSTSALQFFDLFFTTIAYEL